MKVVVFYGSPRGGGNTELLLDNALRAVNEDGHDVTVFRPGSMNISP